MVNYNKWLFYFLIKFLFFFIDIYRNFGNILATEIYEAEATEIYSPSMLNTRLKSVIIDKCYLDTTYFDQIYNNIPSKTNALNAIKRLIENKIENSHTLPVFAIEVSKIGK